jgi:hypothetical protein
VRITTVSGGTPATDLTVFSKSESGFTGLKDIQDLKVAYEQNPANPKIDKILIQTIVF